MKKIFIFVLCICATAAIYFFKYQNTVNPEERIIMINDKLYYGTLETGPMGDSGCVEGEITSSVEKKQNTIRKWPIKFWKHRQLLYQRRWKRQSYG